MTKHVDMYRWSVTDEEILSLSELRMYFIVHMSSLGRVTHCTFLDHLSN